MSELVNKPENMELIEEFEQKFEEGENRWNRIHSSYEDDKEFVFDSKQWDPDQENDRVESVPPRPVITVNKVRKPVNKLVNGIRKSKPGIKVRATGEEDKVLADVRQGMIRAIEKHSNARDCYYNGMNDCAGGGIGMWRIVTEYKNERSNNQIIKFKPIDDCTTVYTSDWQEQDGSDITWCIFKEQYSEERYKSEFGEDSKSFLSHHSVGDKVAWGTNDGPIVSEFWRIVEKDDEAVRDISGKDMLLSELKKKYGDDYELYIAVDEDGKQIRRKTKVPTVKWAKLAGKKVLKEGTWPGKWIPLIMVLGRKYRMKGKLTLFSLIRDSKDAQKAYNYARSSQIERLALTPKAEWMYALGSIPKSEQWKYETSNTRNHWGLGFEAYDYSDPENPKPNPQPTRSQPSMVDPGMSQELIVASDDIKETTGQMDSFDQARSNPISGNALKESRIDGDDNNFDYIESLGKAIRHTGRIIDNLIPFVNDVPMQVAMIGEDEEEKIVWINKFHQKANGESYQYDMDQGEFDLDIEMGASQDTKRQETLEGLNSISSESPEIAEILSDLRIKEHDWRMSGEASERIKRHLKIKYPNIIQDDEDEKLVPPEVLAMQQELEGLREQMQLVSGEYEKLKLDKSIELRKLDIDEKNAETNLIKVHTDADVKIEEANIKAAADIETAKITSQGEIEEELIKNSGVTQGNPPAN